MRLFRNRHLVSWAGALLVTGALGGGSAARQDPAGPGLAAPDAYVARPRIVVMTDIANEPDDQMSLVRFLLYADQFDVEGLVATTSTWMKQEVRPDVILKVLEGYASVLPNLTKHAAGYPPAEALRAAVVSGQPAYGMAAVGPTLASPGSDLILRAAQKPDPRPLWVLAWGGTNTLAQALTSARATRTPAEVAAIVSRLRVYAISDQDDAGPWLRREFPALRYIVSPSTQDGQEYARATWTGISGDLYYRNAPGADFSTFSDDWVNQNIRSRRPLGELYPYPCCIHEGDTPSFLGLINNGLTSAMSPAYGGWGGRYIWRQPSGESRPFWTQGGDSYPGRDNSRDTVTGIDGRPYTSDQATIWRWRRAFQHDFSARMAWTLEDATGTNHNPRVVVNGRPGTDPVIVDATVGVPLTLDAAGTTDPDGHPLTYHWFFYPEAGTGIPGQPVALRVRPTPPVGGAGPGGIPSAPAGGPRQPPPRVVITGADAPRATVEPRVPGIAHVILAVEDGGVPSLTSYRRVILRIKPAEPGPQVAPPAELTADEHHRRMMGLLGIEAVRPGADPRNPQAPNPVNYDEAKAGFPGKLPDPLAMKDGTPVRDADAWWAKRRPEIVEDFDRDVYGRVPADIPGVTWSVASLVTETIGGIPAVTKSLVGRVDNSRYPAISVDIEMTLTTPVRASGPVPVMIEFGFRFPPGMARPPRPPSTVRPGPTWQEQLLARGWGYAVLYPNTIQADNGAGLTRGIIGLVNKGQPRGVDQWGALRAWAWGASRALDYLETDHDVDARRVGIEGLSRYGKAALVTMAYDERFAIAFVASSGAGGAKLLRRRYGEQLENLAGAGQHHWMAGNFIKYSGPLTVDDLPVDAHELVALCAPRPVFVSSGSFEVEGGWVDAKGMFLGAAGAGPVYRLLGRRDMGTTEFPPIETALVEGDIAFRQHTGGHTAGPNWPTFLDFAERYFRPRGAGPATAAGPPRRQIALTFDDLPVHAALPPGMTRLGVVRGLLSALEGRKAPAAYGFVNGRAVGDNPEHAEVLRVWRAAGHPLANHTYSHMDLHASALDVFQQDVIENEGTLRRFAGEDGWRVFRFPYLHEGDTPERRQAVASFLASRGYRLAQVTVNFDDWAFNDPYARCAAKQDTKAIGWIQDAWMSRAARALAVSAKRADRIFGRPIPHVLLLHAGALQPAMLPKLLDLIAAEGYELVTLEQAQADPAYAADVSEAAHAAGGTFLERVAASRGVKLAAAPDDTLSRLSGLCR